MALCNALFYAPPPQKKMTEAKFCDFPIAPVIVIAGQFMPAIMPAITPEITSNIAPGGFCSFHCGSWSPLYS